MEYSDVYTCYKASRIDVTKVIRGRLGTSQALPCEFTFHFLLSLDHLIDFSKTNCVNVYILILINIATQEKEGDVFLLVSYHFDDTCC